MTYSRPGGCDPCSKDARVLTAFHMKACTEAHTRPGTHAVTAQRTREPAQHETPWPPHRAGAGALLARTPPAAALA